MGWTGLGGWLVGFFVVSAALSFFVTGPIVNKMICQAAGVKQANYTSYFTSVNRRDLYGRG